MIKVIIFDKPVNEILEIVKNMREHGFIQGTDFDFEYHAPRFHDWSGDAVYNRHTVFIFYKDELATYFKLKYE